MFVSSVAVAQKPLTVKDSAASQLLNETAKEHVADQAVFNTKLQQARFALDTSNKALQEQIQAAQKDLETKLRADKKYKPMLDNIDALQKKFNDNSAVANTAFQKDAGQIKQKVDSEAVQIQSFEDVVRKENGLPANAKYDEDKQTWTEPEAAKEKK